MRRLQGTRDLSLAWLFCVAPRLMAVAVLWPAVRLGTSSTIITNHVFSSDLGTPLWPPLYSAFAELAWRLSFGWTPGFVLLHVAAQSLLGPAVFVLAERLGLSRREGWIAVAGCALLPYFVGTSVRSMDVGITIAVAAIGAAALARPGLAAGPASAAWVLTRAEALPLVIILWLGGAVIAWRNRGRRWVAGAALFIAILIAWSAANFVRFGAFTPLSANGGANFYIGNRDGVEASLASRSFNPANEPPQMGESASGADGPYAEDAALGRFTWDRLAANPSRVPTLVRLKFLRYWDWELGTVPPHSRAERLAYTVPYVTLLCLLPFGIVKLWRTGRRFALLFLLLALAGQMLPYLVVFGLIRMRMTVEWALILFGASAVGGLRWSPPHAVRSTTRLAS